ncbi:SH3 domain-binding protein 5-like, partial [Dissostichus eleginoides]
MEPGTSREIPNGSGFPEPTGPREETPGEEARGGMLRRRGAEAEPAEEIEADCENEPEHQRNEPEHQRNTGGEEEAGKHEEELDPRIQDELEQLNQASDEINKLELQLDEARSSYRRILTDSARRLNAQGSQLGACIEKARPYYEARRLAKEAQQETQKAALRYERAVSMHTAAREMVYVAEQGLQADRNTLDPTWQEMLNHATAKVGEQATATESSEAAIPSTSEPAPQRSSISNTQVGEQSTATESSEAEIPSTSEPAPQRSSISNTQVGEQSTATESSEAEIPSTSEPAPQRSSISNTQDSAGFFTVLYNLQKGWIPKGMVWSGERGGGGAAPQRAGAPARHAALPGCRGPGPDLQKALKKVIVKSKPYFELKAQFNHILEEHKARVVELEQRVAKVKSRYSLALRNLEQISEQIHAQRARPAGCGGRSSPVGAEAEVRAVGGMESTWADGEKTRLWVERHRESGWGQRERQGGGRPPSECMSVISLQTIASDLEKCDSVEHLGDMSDAGSVPGGEWERDRKRNEEPVSGGAETGGAETGGPQQEKEA